MGKPVVHWELGSKDPEKLHAFYGELFDWKIDADNDMSYGIVRTGGKGGIDGGIGPTDEDGYVTIYVQVDELQPYLDRAQQLGGTTLLEPTETGPVSLAMFADPDGNRIGLVKG